MNQFRRVLERYEEGREMCLAELFGRQKDKVTMSKSIFSGNLQRACERGTMHRRKNKEGRWMYSLPSKADAYKKALASDPLSAFGSVIALNRKVDMDTAELLNETPFIECILAPGFEKKSLELLQKKKNQDEIWCRISLDI